MRYTLDTALAALLIALAVAAPVVGIVGAEEDTLGFNCYVSGNHVCGPDTPIHGFVNLH